ncbi:MAG: tRNA pseudouridine(38-40) synthase TruA [Gammaproteobacteria bacterium]|nr:tRNA pseudouridine(38-40) synthase TruA [Gammaproteobacteria bacterium]MCI0591561.1 tRNA pseudouridine(38-40) synthase TruA [Gammaproteobacteria bacterium]
MRIALGIEYNGRQFFGWQVQNGARTVQACLEEALSKVANHLVKTQCAGRTDTGVHACNQVVHIDSQAARHLRSWVFGTNANLPNDVSVLWAKEVGDAFHARFSAIGRSYRYVILNRAVRPGVLGGKVTWECRALNAESMEEAAMFLIGEHDFTSFRSQACQAKHPVRTVRRLGVARCGELVIIDIEANAFLHHMVRNMVGVLMAIGLGKREPHWADDVLRARDRTVAGVTAPPEGLYLMAVHYPARFNIPQAVDSGWPGVSRTGVTPIG